MITPPAPRSTDPTGFVCPADASTPWLPVCADHRVQGELDYRLSTPSVLVLPARLEWADASSALDVDLVLPRSQCRQGRPVLETLRAAASDLVARHAGRLGRLPDLAALSVPMDGRLHRVALA